MYLYLLMRISVAIARRLASVVAQLILVEFKVHKN
jgi:hypothetical protein